MEEFASVRADYPTVRSTRFVSNRVMYDPLAIPIITIAALACGMRHLSRYFSKRIFSFIHNVHAAGQENTAHTNTYTLSIRSFCAALTYALISKFGICACAIAGHATVLGTLYVELILQNSANLYS